jgi:hypothetical protein
MAAARVTVFTAQALAEARKLSRDGRVQIAEQAASVARGSSPVLTGTFRGGIGVETSGDSVSIVNTDEDAFYIEYGTSDTPAHATMTNAARRFGRYTGMSPGRR